MFENDVTIVGKHATYIKYLVTDAGIFKRYIDVYMNGALLGFLHGRKPSKDLESNDRARVYADAFATERLRCDFIYRLIMLLEETPEYSIDDRVDRAFRDDASGDESGKNEKNMELFNSYVLGGVEVLYEKFADNSTTKEDYINNIYEVVKSFKDEIDNIPLEDKIKEVMADYDVR